MLSVYETEIFTCLYKKVSNSMEKRIQWCITAAWDSNQTRAELTIRFKPSNPSELRNKVYLYHKSDNLFITMSFTFEHWGIYSIHQIVSILSIQLIVDLNELFILILFIIPRASSSLSTQFFPLLFWGRRKNNKYMTYLTPCLVRYACYFFGKMPTISSLIYFVFRLANMNNAIKENEDLGDFMA